MYDIESMTQIANAMFPKVLGMKLTEATTDVLRAEVMVTDDLCTTGKTMHGGAIMTLADFLGAACTMNNLPAGYGTTTIESKTNFVLGRTVRREGHRHVRAGAQRQAHTGLAHNRRA